MISEKIKEIEKEIKETKGKEVVANTECENCGCELLVKKHKLCENCNQMKLQVYKEWEQREKEILEITDGLSRVMLLPHNKERVIAIKLKELLKVIGEKK